MKLKLQAAFVVAMLLAALSGAIPAGVAALAVFVTGALLSQPQGATFANVAGFLSTANAQANDQVGEWQEAVLVRNAKGFNTGSTLFGLMSRLKSEPAESVFFNWWERDPSRITFYGVSSAYAGDTTLQFNDGHGNPVWQLLAANGILLNQRTHERVRIDSDPTNANVTVTRGVQGTTAAVTANGDVWTYVTLAKDEGADPVRAAYSEPSVYTNYCQTFNETTLLSNAFKAGILRTDIEGPLRERRAQALERIANKIEFAYFLGVAEAAQGANGKIYYTGGIQDAIDKSGLTANALNGNGGSGVTLEAFKTWLQAFMQVGSDVKLAFCGPNAYAAISNYANTASAGFRIMNQETVFGMNITNIVTPFGELSLAMHPLFKQSVAHTGAMFVVDLQLIVQKVLEPLFLETNIQTPGQDSYKEQFRAKLGIKQKFPEAFGYAYDLSKITAS